MVTIGDTMLESRMRELRPSGSEDGARFNPWSLPLSHGGL